MQSETNLQKSDAVDCANTVAPSTAGARVAYHHFGDSREVFQGTMTATWYGDFGIGILVQPDKREDMSLLPKWIYLRDVLELLPAIVTTETEKAA